MAWVPSVPYEEQELAAPTVVRCRLLPNPWLLRRALGMQLPWFGAIVLVMVVSTLLSTTGLFDTLEGQYIGLAVVLPIVAAGLVFTVRRSLQRDAVSELELDPNQLSVRDLKTGAVTFSAARSSLTCRIGLRRYNLGRGPRFEHAVLSIEAPGQKRLSIGADKRFAWVESGPVLPAPLYSVEAADWNSLAHALGAFSAPGAAEPDR